MAELDRKIVALEEELSRAQHERKSSEAQCEHLLRVVKDLIDEDTLRSEEFSKQVASLKLYHELEIAAARRRTAHQSPGFATPQRMGEVPASYSNASDTIGLSAPAIAPIEPFAETPLIQEGRDDAAQLNYDNRDRPFDQETRQAMATSKVVLYPIILGDHLIEFQAISSTIVKVGFNGQRIIQSMILTFSELLNLFEEMQTRCTRIFPILSQFLIT